MKGSYKRIAAITLSLAMIAGNAGNFLTTSNALTAKALTVTAAEAQGKDESYYDTETQTLHLKGYVKNSNDGSGIILPDSIDKNEVLYIVAEEGTVLPVNCSHLCEGFIHILSMDFSKADTSNVTDMSYMFMPFEDISNCYSLGVCCYGIDVSNFDTSNVTTMKGMFKNCIEVPELDLSSFDTSKVTDMSEMFSCCGYYYYEGPQSLDLSSFDTSEVKDMSKMFYECEALREIDLSRFDTSNVTDMSDMFNSCRHLLTFDLSNFDTSKVTNMKDMFCNCTDLNSLNISSFNTSKVTNMSGMFQQCYSLKNADLSNFNTSQVTDMSRMFYVNVLFKDIDVSSFDTSNVTDMNFMFSNCVSLESLDLRNFDTHKVTDMRYMFDNCRRLKFVDLSSFDTRNVSNMYCMFNGDSVLETIMVGQEWSTELASGNNMFSSCNSLVGGAGTVYDPNHVGIEYAHVDGGKNDPGYFTFKEYKKDESYYDSETKTLHLKGYLRNSDDGSGFILPASCKGFKIERIVADEGAVFPENCSRFFYNHGGTYEIDLKNADTSHVTDMSYMFMFNEEGSYVLNKIDLSNIDTSNVTNMEGMFEVCFHISELDLSSFDTSNVTNMSYMFRDCWELRSLNLSSFDTSNVTDMSNMFDWCCDLKSLDLSNFDTSNVTDMSGMFWSCVDLKSLDLGSFDTSNVTDMSEMFLYCPNLESLDLSSFDTSNVTDMSNMFCESYSLGKIYVGSGWLTESIEKSDCMFKRCEELKGGAGTAYDPNHVGIEYAHVDGGKDNPGYLTLKNNDLFKAQSLNLTSQIEVCFHLDLSSLTEQERNESYMEFKINGRTSKVPFKDSKNPRDMYYSFICNVTIAEMADTITAIFHYGNGNSVSKEYSVLDYINIIENKAEKYDNATHVIVRSLADYGHYFQPFLAAYNNWTVGKEHKEMTKYYTDSYSYDTIKNETSKYQRVLDLGESDIEKITYSLNFNSGTALNVFIKAKDNYNGSVKVTTKKGNTVMSYNAVKQADGRYKVTIPNIIAHQLGDMYTITAETTNGTATCSLSALSYVYAILSGSSYDKTAKDAVSSLYKYYEATMNYRSKS